MNGIFAVLVEIQVFEVFKFIFMLFDSQNLWTLTVAHFGYLPSYSRHYKQTWKQANFFSVFFKIQKMSDIITAL